jgi:hypothetical protein
MTCVDTYALIEAMPSYQYREAVLRILTGAEKQKPARQRCLLKFKQASSSDSLEQRKQCQLFFYRQAPENTDKLAFGIAQGMGVIGVGGCRCHIVGVPCRRLPFQALFQPVDNFRIQAAVVDLRLAF